MTQSMKTDTALPIFSHEYWQRQAVLCQWFANLIIKELDEPALAAYRAGDAAPLLGWLGEDGLGQEADALQSAIAGFTLLEHPRLELAADFATLFLSDARHSAAPYASCYLGERGSFMKEPAQRMAERLRNAGVILPADVNEPADHLAVMLDYLAGAYRQLSEQPLTAQSESLTGISQFLQEELCSWLPAFSQRCLQTPVVSPFYPTLTQLINNFCQQRLQEANRG